MLNALSGSKNSFSFSNITPVDEQGNQSDALLFDGNVGGGGGTIWAGALMDKGVSDFSKLESTGHELFHGYQYEMGQGGRSIFNEVEANVFGYYVADAWAYGSSDFVYLGGLSGTGLGNGSQSGMSFEQAFTNLKTGFSRTDFINTINNFRSGSQKNAGGHYNSYPSMINERTRMQFLLPAFYPFSRK